MRIFRDLGLVEQLGSGIPRILKYYTKDSFLFSDNFIRVQFNNNFDFDNSNKHLIDNFYTPQEAPKYNLSNPQLLEFLNKFNGEHSRADLMQLMNLKDIKNFRKNYLDVSIGQNYIELTIPNKPKSNKQKYRLTEVGKQLVSSLK